MPSHSARHFCYLAVAIFCSLCVTPAFASLLDFGKVAATFPLHAKRVVADPARNQMYALVTTTESVAVIDTATLKVTATIPTGPTPADMALSLDGKTLYVANRGSAAQAVAALDLDSLQVRHYYSLPGPAIAVAAGLGGRVYTALKVDYSQGLYQFDSDTGTVQTKLSAYDSSSLLKISPDGKTLFAATAGISPSSITGYDVSTATPKAAQGISNAGGNGEQLSVSHGGAFLCLADGGGNDEDHGTYLYSAANLSQHFGTFKDDDHIYPQRLDFSPDDAVVYEVFTSGSDNALNAYSTQTFSLLAQASLPLLATADSSGSIESIATDHTGSYVFVAQTNDNEGTFQVSALATGTGSLAPAVYVPVVSAPKSGIYGGVGMPFHYQIIATHSPTSYAASNLPPGLSLDPATGVISGTPTEVAYQPIVLSASNASGIGVGASSYIQVDAVAHAPQITSSALGYGETYGLFYYQITANYAPTSFAVAQLPPGLNFDAGTGVISGTVNQAGNYIIALFASNDYGVGVGQLTLYISAGSFAPQIVDAPATAIGVVGENFHYQFIISNRGSHAAFDLPDGLTFDQHTGIIAGKPTTPGRYVVRIAAGNYWGNAYGTFTVTIIPSTTPIITSETTAAAQVDAPFRYRTRASGPEVVYSAVGLPAGLTLNPANGVIKGRPTTAGVYQIGLTATDAAGAGTDNLMLTVGPALAPVPVILATVAVPTATLADGGVGEFLLTRQGPISSDILVYYALGGRAVNGTDYTFLKGATRIRAGKTSKLIKIVPKGNLGGAASKSVTLTILNGAGYATPVRSAITVNITSGL